MNKPTEVEIKEFWEWCGFKGNASYGLNQATYPDGGSSEWPDIDLNNLCTYAVPKVWEIVIENQQSQSNALALALFWAIKALQQPTGASKD